VPFTSYFDQIRLGIGGSGARLARRKSG
jgi:hypothetical protein